MKRLSEEAKKSVVEKALTRKGRALSEIASLHNIGYSTLHKWIAMYKSGMVAEPKNSNTSSHLQITRSEQFQHLLATSSLDETELGAYCREHGLYSFQIQQWKNEFMSQIAPKKKQEQQSELKALRAENKLLKQDLNRKNKALAETTALLVLKKKASLIWGEREDD